MAKISIALNATEQATGKKLQKTLTDINAAATSTQIKTFAQALNNLTTNNYVETNRIEKTNVDTEQTSSTKKDQQIEVVSPWVRSAITGGEAYETASITGAVGTVVVEARRTDDEPPSPIRAFYTGESGYDVLPPHTVGLTYYEGVSVQATLVATGNNEYNPAVKIMTLDE